MRLHLINPNTSRAMTGKIAASAREVAGPDVVVTASCPADGEGPAAIESHTDEAYAAVAVLREIARAESDGDGPDAFAIACFGDPGLDAARESASSPVVGIAEAAMHAAVLAGRTFGVVTTLSRTLGRAHDLVVRYGFTDACVAAYAADIGVLELEDTGSHAYEAIAALCERAVHEDGADTVVLGCAGMTDLYHALSARVGVPVIDGVQASVGLLAGLVRMGVTTSRRDEYAHPPLRRAVPVL
jgi:allantoin racemase